MRTLKQVRSNRWEADNGDYIWKDDFGDYQIQVNGFCEVATSLEKAINIINNPKYYN